MLFPKVEKLEKLKEKLQQIREHRLRTKEQLVKVLGESKVREILVFLAKNFSFREIRELTGWSNETIRTLLRTFSINYEPSVSPRHKTLHFLKKPLSEILRETLSIGNIIDEVLRKIRENPEYFRTLYFANLVKAGYILAYLLYVKQQTSTEIAKTLKLQHKTTVLNIIKQLGLTPLGLVKQKKYANILEHGIIYAKQIAQNEADKHEEIHKQIVKGKTTYQQIENINPEVAEKLVIHMYWNRKLSINILSKLYRKDQRTLRKILEKHGLTTRPKRKYDKKPFTGNLIEEAYIYGLALGDVTLRKHSQAKTATASLSTPKPAMIKLFIETFQKYTEAIWIQPKRTIRRGKEYYEWRLTAYLDRTFEKLIPDKNKIPEKYLQNEEAFYSLLAALTDCEGSIILRTYEKERLIRLIFKLGMTSKDIIETVHRKMLKLGYKSHLHIQQPSNSMLGKKPMYIIILYGRNAYGIIQKIKPYMKHDEKLEKIKLYQHYISLRRTEKKDLAYELTKKMLIKLKRKIKQEAEKNREKAKKQYQKKKTPTFSTPTSPSITKHMTRVYK